MNEPPITGAGPRSDHPALRLDAARDRFEAACAGRRPRIEDCLVEVAESERTGLRRELLEVELELRRGEGETPGQDGPAAGSSRFRILRPHAQRRPGRGLRRPRRGAAPRGGPQGDPARPRRRRRQPGPVRARGRDHRRLEHPGIVPVYGLGDLRRRPAVLRHAVHPRATASRRRSSGSTRRTGRAAIPASGRWPCASCCGRFIDVCNAIAYAHSRGVLHRDLKPGNIMLGKYGETLVVDWGLAKAIGRPRRRRRGSPPSGRCGPPRPAARPRRSPASALGTPAYMSPEQAAGRLDRLGPASDVYSLGATLYCLLTGRAPLRRRRRRRRAAAPGRARRVRRRRERSTARSRRPWRRSA